MTPLDQFIVSFLAALSGFVLAFFIDGILVQDFGKGRVRSQLSHKFIGKATGTAFIILEVMAGAAVAVGTDPLIEQLYTSHMDKVGALYVGNIFTIAVLARARIGGEYSWIGKTICILLGILAGLAFLYGTSSTTESPN
ncbi:MAG: hypothetical protein ACREBU_09130 [Nitrososphaera sp.]